MSGSENGNKGGVFRKLISLVKYIFGIIVVLAGGMQVYNFVWKGEVTEGPIPLQEAKNLLTEVQKFIGSKEYTKARDKCEKLLEDIKTSPNAKEPELKLASCLKAEAFLNLKFVKGKGVEVADRPELKKEIPLHELEGGEALLKEIKAKTQEIKVTGKGFPPQGMQGGRAKLMAERAAKLDAYRLILIELKGIKINTRLNMDTYLGQPEVSSRIEGTIRGAKVTDTRYLPDGLVEVDMVLGGAALSYALDRKGD